MEVTIACAVIVILLGAFVTAMLSQTRATDAGVRTLLAKCECDRALLALVEDLQTTNTVEMDQGGQPYVRILSGDDGQGAKMEFRRVEGFIANADDDSVTMRYGTPIRYELTGENQLVRRQDGVERVLANRVASCRFSLTAQGTIECRLVTFSGSGAERVEVVNDIAVTPRNGFDR
jgi:hypothetical protein